MEPADYTLVSEDGFGNRRLSGCCHAPHTGFGYQIIGTAVTKGMGVQKGQLHPMYRYPSALPGSNGRWYPWERKSGRRVGKKEARTPLEMAVCAMEYLYTHFTYVSGVTDIGTTAGDALKLGKGVCQDYAHIMIAVMRFLGIPARYVNGLMIGEGSTHAWVYRRRMVWPGPHQSAYRRILYQTCPWA
ncbi:MAG: transglutaminase family protein [Eubacterium sp.]